jgi:hypothetical protein
MGLTNLESKSLEKVSKELGINPQWLYELIAFETGGSFDPKKKNPLSSARGLIQFIDSTAKGLGYENALDLVTKHPTFISQLEGPVYKYLSRLKPFPNEYSLFMAVFFPVARKYTPDTSFKEIYSDTFSSATWESKYNQFAAQNPKILTPQDYFDKVKGQAKVYAVVAKHGSWVTLSLAVGLFIYLYR